MTQNLCARVRGLIPAVLAAVLVAACGGGGGGSADPVGNPLDDPQSNPPVANNAYEQLQTLPDTTIVAQALARGGVLHQMSGAGDYTFFAPTDAAMNDWAAARGETVTELLADNNEMYRVMKYHIIPERYAVSDLPFNLPMTGVRDEVMKAVNFNPGGLNVALFDGKGFQANLDLAASNVVTANATIHVIDRVMFPTESNVAQLLRQKPGLGLYADILEAALGADLLSNEGEQFTVFAPTDDAIDAVLAALGGITNDDLINAPANSVLAARRNGIAGYHLLNGVYQFVEQLPKGTPIPTRLLTRNLTIDPASLQITDETGGVSNFVERDGIAKNGVIHVIDRVLLTVPLQ